MRFIDFTLPGGYRLKQKTFKMMQESYYEILKALMGYLGVADDQSYIISGCQVDGANITPGLMYIDGELCAFAGAPGTAHTKIVKDIQIETLSFQNGTNPAVWRTVTAKVSLTADGVELADFKLLPPVQAMIWDNLGNIPADLVYDATYVHTDNNFTTALKNKLNGIAAGAEVNVQADWNTTDDTDDSFIKNKPQLLDVLKQGTFNIGDFGDPAFSGFDDLIEVPFADIGTSDYRVLYSLESAGNWNIDNDTISIIRNKTSASFKIALREVSGSFSMVQDLVLEYDLIRKQP